MKADEDLNLSKSGVSPRDADKLIEHHGAKNMKRPKTLTDVQNELLASERKKPGSSVVVVSKYNKKNVICFNLPIYFRFDENKRH